MANPEHDIRRALEKVPDERVLRIANAAAQELISRGVPLPNPFLPESQEGQQIHHAKLINPLHEPKSIPDSVLADGRVVVNHAEGEVRVDGSEFHLSPIRYGLLAVLAANAGAIVTRRFMLFSVWHHDETKRDGVDPINKVDNAIFRLRVDLGEDDLGHLSHGVIQTVTGTGWVGMPHLNRHR